MSTLASNVEDQHEHLLEMEASVCPQWQRGRKVKHRAAYSFAEVLMLCLDDKQVSKSMEADPIGTRSFLTVLQSVIVGISRGLIHVEKGQFEGATPYCLSSSLVLKVLSQLREYNSMFYERE